MKLLPEETSESWADFVGNQLKDMNEKNTIIPASSYVNEVSSNEDDDSDFRDLHFPQESALQQVIYPDLNCPFTLEARLLTF